MKRIDYGCNHSVLGGKKRTKRIHVKKRKEAGKIETKMRENGRE